MTLIKTNNGFVLITSENKRAQYYKNEDDLIDAAPLPPIELVIACDEMKKNRHNVSKFGVCAGTFLYSDIVNDMEF